MYHRQSVRGRREESIRNINAGRSLASHVTHSFPRLGRVREVTSQRTSAWEATLLRDRFMTSVDAVHDGKEENRPISIDSIRFPIVQLEGI